MKRDSNACLQGYLFPALSQRVPAGGAAVWSIERRRMAGLWGSCSCCHGGGWQRINTFFPFPVPTSSQWPSLSSEHPWQISLTSLFVLKKWLLLVFFLNSNFKQLCSCWENVWWLFWAIGKRAKLLHSTETLHNDHNASVYLLSWRTSSPRHRARSICVLLYPGRSYVSLKAQLNFIFYETFSKSPKKD